VKHDPQRVATLISSLVSSLKQLKRLRNENKEAFISDLDKVASTKYHFIVVIDAAVDLCQHLIAKNALRVPENYGDAFRILAKEQVIPAELLNNLLNMVKFRNRLVHVYWNIDDETVYGLLQDHLNDLDEFLDAISRVIVESS